MEVLDARLAIPADLKIITNNEDLLCD